MMADDGCCTTVWLTRISGCSRFFFVFSFLFFVLYFFWFVFVLTSRSFDISGGPPSDSGPAQQMLEGVEVVSVGSDDTASAQSDDEAEAVDVGKRGDQSTIHTSPSSPPPAAQADAQAKTHATDRAVDSAEGSGQAVQVQPLPPPPAVDSTDVVTLYASDPSALARPQLARQGVVRVPGGSPVVIAVAGDPTYPASAAAAGAASAGAGAASAETAPAAAKGAVEAAGWRRPNMPLPPTPDQ
jgi:hypothetical protein